MPVDVQWPADGTAPWGNSLRSGLNELEAAVNSVEGQVNEVSARVDDIATFEGTQITADQINTLTTAGRYYSTDAPNQTPANGWPEGLAGTYQFAYVDVLYPGSAHAVQEVAAGSGTAAYRSFWRRSWNGSTWTTWVRFASTRIDKTAGTAVYLRDHAANTDLLIHGDTGWRDITSELVNGWTAGGAQIRRVGYTVTLALYQLDPAGRTANDFYMLPIAFLPWKNVSLERIVNTSASFFAHTDGRVISTAGSIVSTGVWSEYSWHTGRSWPTTLPGTPA